ncbi:CGNR zinc finger domain-containing protein [Nonomuraea sp. NPDC050404]|uniref:CGNR zinc finger domain-containing protein n=1 Tax=Nonomuraea sp. NPDC050404 TaxID=3155783 RepID=UPI0033F270C2
MMQRPLVGEPLALDLVNTQWVDRGRDHDLFDEPGGVAAWLAEHHLPGPAGPAETPLRQARAALRGILERGDERAEEELNAVLARGAVRHVLRQGMPREEVHAEDGWLPAWRAAGNYLELLRQQPSRIRHCAHPACVLYFYDTSRNGARRWCSMEGCGSRTKAARHYQRNRTTTPS